MMQRSTVWAMLLSAVVPGLGQWYVGAFRPAWVLAVIYLLAVPGVLVSLVALDAQPAIAMWFYAGAGGLLRAVAAVHAGVLAKHIENFEPSEQHSIAGFLGFIGFVVGLGLVESRSLREHVIETARVPAMSGRPNLDESDHILITKLRDRDREPRHGDLITFEVPSEAPGETTVFVKRVAALEGEVVSIVDGVVSLDGILLTTTRCEDRGGLVLSTGATCMVEQTPEGASYPIQVTRPEVPPTPGVLVPPGHVFVVGDNRSESHDSRNFGPVHRDAVTGRVRAIWRPLSRRRSLDP